MQSEDYQYFGGVSEDGKRQYADTISDEALDNCVNCPVFDVCLAQCLDNREEYGIWALTTPAERRAIFFNERRGITTRAESNELLTKISHKRQEEASDEHRAS